MTLDVLNYIIEYAGSLELRVQKINYRESEFIVAC